MSEITKIDNGANLIINALLARMSELDRFSDDEIEISGAQLLPLDVIIDKDGEFGFVGELTELGFDDEGNKRLFVYFVGDIVCVSFHKPRYVRTIYETEGAEARAYLIKYFGDKKWL